MVKVLVVEDTLTGQELLVHILSQDPEIQVVGIAGDGLEAVEALPRLRPDVVVMDINMPRMNGFEATGKIMATQPVPIIIVSATYDIQDTSTSFRALEAGAVAALNKPVGLGAPGHLTSAQELVKMVKLMSEVKVVTRKPRRPAPRIRPPAPRGGAAQDFQLVAIGTSTGGPQVLQTILMGLPKDLPVPILVVQHISTGFLDSLVGWLANTTGFPVRKAVHFERPLPGHVYFAPDDFHMALSPSGAITLRKSPHENGLRPSVAHLFRSVAETVGDKAIAVLLTGMGQDGAEELLQLRNLGAFTITQDQATSVVFGMPGEAVRLNAADKVLAPNEIAEQLAELLCRPGKSNTGGDTL